MVSRGLFPQRPVDTGPLLPSLGDFPWDLLPPPFAATLLSLSPAPPLWSSHGSKPSRGAPVPEKEQQVPECGPALWASFPAALPHLLRPWPPLSSGSALAPSASGTSHTPFPHSPLRLPSNVLITCQFPGKPY